MKKFLMTAALAVLFAAPAFAQDAAPVDPAAAPAVEAPAAPVTDAAAPAVDAAAAAKEACTTETNEKVKLPENAGDAEKAQWDAAFAECLKGKGIEETPAADAAPAEAAPVAPAGVATDAAPAATTEPEAKADAAAE